MIVKHLESCRKIIVSLAKGRGALTVSEPVEAAGALRPGG